MGKKLSEMTIEELWELFPIILTEHNVSWKEWYNEEVSLIKEILCEIPDAKIHHVGSTAIHTICAKPIIDILVEIPQKYELCSLIENLTTNGYICMSQSKERVSFNKGYTENGFAEKVYHLHLHYMGDNDELYFRDYLIEYPDIAKEYEQMKINLWKEYEHNRDEYTNAKSNFVFKYTKQAKELYGNKY